tara:strand:+ start:226 stop:414 length:189 start_codon:yes stop_codon:yes gene_type:complete
MIESEWIINLKKDIFEGPKYLLPLIELIELKLKMFFLNDPEKLLHRLSLLDNIFKSLLVRQL